MKIVAHLEEWYPVPVYYLPESESKDTDIADVPDEVVREYDRAKEAFILAAKALHAAAHPDDDGKTVWGWQ